MLGRIYFSRAISFCKLSYFWETLLFDLNVLYATNRIFPLLFKTSYQIGKAEFVRINYSYVAWSVGNFTLLMDIISSRIPLSIHRVEK
jgi:hypothetical protein